MRHAALEIRGRRPFRGIHGVLAWAAAIAALGSNGTAAPRSARHNSYLDQDPPELVSEAGHWIGSEGKVSLKKLRGNVVLLAFNF